MKKIIDITSTVVLVLVIILAILLVGVRLFGLSPYTVLSGSMRPTYPVGSLIYVTEVEPEELEIGDPLTYVIPGDTVVTHRIVEIIDEGDELKFRVKGDANDEADGTPVPAKNIIGKPVFSIPVLGYLAYFVQHRPGNFISIGLLVLFLSLTFLPELFKTKKPEESEEDPSSPEDGSLNAERSEDGGNN